MKSASSISLLSAIAILCLAACSPSPEEGGPIAGPADDQGAAVDASATGDESVSGDTGAQIVQNGIKVSRLRLPDMEKLPSDRELTSTGNADTDGGGVIARPPSE